MKKFLILPLLLFATVALGRETPAVVSNGDIEAHSTIQSRFDTFYRYLNGLRVESRSRRSGLVRQHFRKNFESYYSERAIDETSKDDRHLLFQAAFLCSFEDPESNCSSFALSALDGLDKIGDVSDQEVMNAYGMLFQARRMEELKSLEVRFEARDLPGAPAISFQDTKPGLPREVLTFENGKLEARAIPKIKGPEIIVVAHPLCHFTQNAVKAINSDPELTELISSRSYWIAPPDMQMDFKPFETWRVKHSEFPIHIAYSYASWAALDKWGTPTFYFFKDGQLERVLEGWPSGGHMNELKADMKAIGLAVKQSE